MPQALVAFSEVLACAIGLAVGGMGSWHWYLVRLAAHLDPQS
jgi:palmitoyltransferase